MPYAIAIITSIVALIFGLGFGTCHWIYHGHAGFLIANSILLAATLFGFLLAKYQEQLTNSRFEESFVYTVYTMISLFFVMIVISPFPDWPAATVSGALWVVSLASWLSFQWAEAVRQPRPQVDHLFLSSDY